jgi:hypothetical protein
MCSNPYLNIFQFYFSFKGFKANSNLVVMFVSIDYIIVFLAHMHNVLGSDISNFNIQTLSVFNIKTFRF